MYCFYCQDVLSAEKMGEIKSPNGDVQIVCEECLGDINNFFKSGNAETCKLMANENHQGELQIDIGLRTLFEITEEGCYRKFPNVILEGIIKTCRVVPDNLTRFINAGINVNNLYSNISVHTEERIEFHGYIKTNK